MFLARKISFVRGLLYVVFQCSGAAIGSVILKGVGFLLLHIVVRFVWQQVSQVAKISLARSEPCLAYPKSAHPGVAQNWLHVSSLATRLDVTILTYHPSCIVLWIIRST